MLLVNTALLFFFFFFFFLCIDVTCSIIIIILVCVTIKKTDRFLKVTCVKCWMTIRGESELLFISFAKIQGHLISSYQFLMKRTKQWNTFPNKRWCHCKTGSDMIEEYWNGSSQGQTIIWNQAVCTLKNIIGNQNRAWIVSVSSSYVALRSEDY